MTARGCTVGAAVLGAVLAVAVPAYWWLRCPGKKEACQ